VGGVMIMRGDRLYLGHHQPGFQTPFWTPTNDPTPRLSSRFGDDERTVSAGCGHRHHCFVPGRGDEVVVMRAPARRARAGIDYYNLRMGL